MEHYKIKILQTNLVENTSKTTKVVLDQLVKLKELIEVYEKGGYTISDVNIDDLSFDIKK